MAKNPADFSDEISSNANIVSFVIRAWSEEPSSDEDQEIWRGHITPIPNGTRYYFKDFSEIPRIILHYLKSIGGT